MTVNSKLQLVLDVKATLGEGPSWDVEQGILYWVDILAHKFNGFDPIRGANEQYDVGELIGAVVPASNGDMILATKSGFKRYRMEDHTITLITDPEADLPSNRFNDGKCDPQGRFWAGTMDHTEQAFSGSLYCLNKDGSCRKMHEGVGVSNGIAWSPDHKCMYYVDSKAQTVTCFDFDPMSGNITNPRIVIDFEQEQGWPDGMTIDAEGMLWIAHWDGWQLSRWNPQTGRKLETMQVPVAKVTSCAFGGSDLDTLYITTASLGVEVEQQSNQPHAGGIFAIQPGVKGIRESRFMG